MKRIFSVLLAVVLMSGMLAVEAASSDMKLEAKVKSDMIGNIFFDAEYADFDVIFQNDAEEAVTITAQYRAYPIGNDMNRKSAIFSVDREYTIDGFSDKGDSLKIQLDGYGLYELNVVVLNGSMVIKEYNVPFSNAVRNTTQNSSVGVNVHLVWRGNADQILCLVKNSGMGTIREVIEWSGYEKKKGVYKLTDKQKNMLEKAEKYGLDVLTLISVANNIYDNTGSHFLREAEVDKYKSFLEHYLKEPLVIENVSKIEIMNEPDLRDIVDGEVVGDDEAGHTKRAKAYARMVKATKTVVDSIEEKDYKTGIFSITGIAYDSAKMFADLALSNLEKGNFDTLTLHPYMDVDKNPEYNLLYGNLREQANYYRNLANGSQSGSVTRDKYNFGVSEPMWLTEFGYSSATGEDPVNLSVGDEYKQATMLIRALDQLKKGNINDIAYIYEMSSHGTDATEREHNFEMVRSYLADTPYAAKFAYLAVSNYNSLTYDATRCTQVVSPSFSQNACITEYTCPDRKVYLLRTTSTSGTTYNYNLGSDIKYYDLFGNKLSESDIKTSNGYKLTTTPFYAVVGEDIQRVPPSGSTLEEAFDDGELVVSGRTISPDENARISLTVTEEDAVFGEAGFMDSILYMNQSVTGVGGKFELTAKIPSRDRVKAYVVAENGEQVVLTFELGGGDTVKEIKLYSDGTDAKNMSMNLLNMNNLFASVDFGTDSEVDYMLICAVYSGNGLADVKLFDGSLPKESGLIDQPFGFEVQECDRLLIMVIRDDGSLTPLCEAYIKN